MLYTTKMTRYLLFLFITTKFYEVTNLPSHYKISKDIIHTPIVMHQPEPNSIIHLTRKQKGPSIPYQILVPNLHVIPISAVQHQDNVQHNTVNVTQQLIPVLIPFHNYVPVHDLTVIPLHRVSDRKIAYRVEEDVDEYRNPLGGYGVGWTFGGHGAGHGFHYSYYG